MAHLRGFSHTRSEFIAASDIKKPWEDLKTELEKAQIQAKQVNAGSITSAYAYLISNLSYQTTRTHWETQFDQVKGLIDDCPYAELVQKAYNLFETGRQTLSSQSQTSQRLLALHQSEQKTRFIQLLNTHQRTLEDIKQTLGPTDPLRSGLDYLKEHLTTGITQTKWDQRIKEVAHLLDNLPDSTNSSLNQALNDIRSTLPSSSKHLLHHYRSFVKAESAKFGPLERAPSKKLHRKQSNKSKVGG